MIFVPALKEYNYFQLVQLTQFLVLFECTLSPIYVSASNGTGAVLMLKSDIGTWTFSLINIGNCNSKSSIVLVNDISELP